MDEGVFEVFSPCFNDLEVSGAHGEMGLITMRGVV